MARATWLWVDVVGFGTPHAPRNSTRADSQGISNDAGLSAAMPAKVLGTRMSHQIVLSQPSPRDQNINNCKADEVSRRTAVLQLITGPRGSLARSWARWDIGASFALLRDHCPCGTFASY